MMSPCITSRRIGIFILLVFASFIVSCKKEASNKLKKVNDTAYAVLTDTGFKSSGAVMLNSMLADTVRNLSFKASAPIRLSNAHDIIIRGISTASITLYNCSNITIRRCKIGPNKTLGIDISSCTNINIDSCYITQVSTGVYAGYSQRISVTNCQAKNMLGPFPQGQFVQFNMVSGVGNRVNFNKFENVLGQSYTEDAISLYNCNGLPGDPIEIESNWLRGGGPSKSGGGIMLGDGGGSNQVAKNNILVDPGQYGMAVSGGDYMSIINNTVYAKSQPFTNCGLYYRNYFGPPSLNIVITKNDVNFTNSGNQLNNTYLGPGDPAPIGWVANVYKSNLDATILPANVVSGSLFELNNN
ncbi:MAG: right-handed parallel beta-helix repeat-containing protein [Sphingobacteriales bacterium]